MADADDTVTRFVQSMVSDSRRVAGGLEWLDQEYGRIQARKSLSLSALKAARVVLMDEEPSEEARQAAINLINAALEAQTD